jgi:hypothetical protein
VEVEEVVEVEVEVGREGQHVSLKGVASVRPIRVY